MPKSPVERYEQILQQDPSSTAFVELAKALIEAGDAARAIEVCQNGLTHHPKSTIARVLWGKSLIHLGRPAEAMAQFDSAIAIEKDNPYAYNLIAEVLLQRGLYRSALPILRKASALQPNNGRIKEWLEKTQAALSGGPTPSAVELVDPASPLSLRAQEEPVSGPAKSVAPAVAPVSPGAPERSVVVGTEGSQPAVARPPGDTDPFGGDIVLPNVASDRRLRPSGVRPSAEATKEMPALRQSEIAAELRGGGDSGSKTLSPAVPARALAAQPRARGESGIRAVPVPGEEGPPAAESPVESSAGNPSTSPGEPAAESANASSRVRVSGLKPAVAASKSGEKRPLTSEPAAASKSGEKRAVATADPGLLGDIPALEGDAPPAQDPAPPALVAARPPAERPRSSGEKRALLDEIPELNASSSSLEVPKVELSTSSAHEIAQQYERELRDKLAQNAAKKSFLTQHGPKVAIAAVVLIALGVGLFAFISTRLSNRGRDLYDALNDAKKAIALDTAQGYRTALEALDSAVAMDEDSSEAWALKAYAHSVVFAEHGGAAADRKAAQEALERPGVATEFSGYDLVTRYYIADSKGRESLKSSVLSSSEKTAEVLELAGRILLSQGKDTRGAVERFRQALELSSGNVRALVALGNYYRESGDHPTALKFYETAAMVSPEHPERTIGAAESRLESDAALAQTLEEVEKIPVSEQLSPDLLARRELVLGRLLTANGRAPEAVKRLTEGVKGFRSRGFEFNMALGEAAMAAGSYGRAEEAFEAALKVKPGHEEAQELLGRVLIARGREKDVLGRIRGDGRRIALVRGIALARMADWKRARAELGRTQAAGKFPTEAVMYLALADAAEAGGNVAPAQEILEKVVGASKRAKSDGHVALGQLYLQQGLTDKALAQFELAQRDPLDFEGACAAGRLRLKEGKIDQALPLLERAVQKNDSHGEARHALGRLYLARGKTAEGLLQARGWQQADPSNSGAVKDLAYALHLAGQWKEADASSSRIVKMAPQDPEAHRIRAMVLFSLGDAKAAMTALERANKLDPKDPETFCEIGHAFLRQGNTTTAEAAFSAAQKNDPESDCGKIGEALARLPAGAKGAVKLLADRSSKAAHAWDRAQAFAALARAQLATGAVAAARKSAQEAVTLAPSLGNGHYALGLVAVKEKDLQAAVTTLKQAVDLEPAHIGMRLAYADALAARGDIEPALLAYETFLRLGGEEDDEARVEKLVADLKKKIASR